LSGAFPGLLFTVSPGAHFAIFWLAGLLTGTLLGWMLGRGTVVEARQHREVPQNEPHSDSRRAA
jgi:hypothetical protein